VYGRTRRPISLFGQDRGLAALKHGAQWPLFRSDPDDVAVLVEGVRLARRILKAPSLSALVGEEVEADGAPCDETNSGVEAKVRKYAKTVYHPGGTCRMGKHSMAVVDNELRVHGVDGLRVADVSVMPTIPRGNTNAGTIMIAERAAAFVKAATTNRL
jgi:choline dehydrogenase